MQLEFGGRRYAVAAGDFVIGSEPDSTLVLTAPAVLPRHAVVRSVGQGMAVLVPAAPGAEILVNGVRLGSDPIPLKSGDKIAIGGQEIIVSDPAPSGGQPVPPSAASRLNETVAGFPAMRRPPPMPRPEPPIPGPSGAAARLNETVAGFPAMRRPPPMPRQEAAPLASLLVKSGNRKGERLTVLSPVTNFGRAEFSDLRLPDPSVSATHARLQLREGIWSIADLGSANGTKVDGEPIRDETALSPGATISIGEVQLLFEPQDQAGASAGGPRAAVAPAVAPPQRTPSVPPPPPSPRTRQAVVAVVVALGILLLVGYFLLR
jgi:pSer/pThr/pTyr-binding forkhead associated (FHA) protein